MSQTHRVRTLHRAAPAAIAVALSVVLTGCGSAEEPVAAPTSASTAAPGSATTTAAAPTTTVAPTPETVEQDCPYLDTATVQDTVGQQTPTVTTTGVPGGPPPTCTFLKPNDEAAATVEVSQATDAIAAQTAAVQRVAGIGGTAVDDIADGGGIASTDGGTVLAVADGTLVVVVTINQASSLQARELAQAVVAVL
ncbi:DUF2020 domain-containing protein [Geodermatophilaceae bacterium NBWT11]|jgi:hypothetical protein|nr:DUF2020 domain-containing protein [Geodermatophilaceae bacterium NBWT11]